MTIARTVMDCLQKGRIAYQVIAHPHRESSRESAEASHVPPERLAKAVVVGDQQGCLMAVIPGNCHLDLTVLSQAVDRKLELVTEDRLAPVFPDCDLGAIPPLGPAYGLETVLDDSLVGRTEVCFEAGDHEELICVGGEQFLQLLEEARHGHFSHQ